MTDTLDPKWLNGTHELHTTNWHKSNFGGSERLSIRNFLWYLPVLNLGQLFSFPSG